MKTTLLACVFWISACDAPARFGTIDVDISNASLESSPAQDMERSFKTTEPENTYCPFGGES